MRASGYCLSTCEFCGVEFERRADRTGPAYCSVKCLGQAKRAAAAAKYPPREEVRLLYEVEGLSDGQIGRRYGFTAKWASSVRRHHGIRTLTPSQRAARNHVQLVCEQCGRTYSLTELQARRRGSRFCSSACQHRSASDEATESYPPREEVVNFYITQGESDRVWARRFGRSHAWALKVRRHYGIKGRARTAPKKPLEKRSDQYRWSIRLKPAPACRRCGREGVTLHLHHIVPRSMCKASKYDLRNGVQLCVECHMGWHNRNRVVYRDIFTAEEWEYVSGLDLLGQNIEAWLDDRYPARPTNSIADRQAA